MKYLYYIQVSPLHNQSSIFITFRYPLYITNEVSFITFRYPLHITNQVSLLHSDIPFM